MEAYRDAFETRNGTTAFIAAAVADVLREREVIPETMKVTTFMPKGSATATSIVRRDRMNEQEISTLEAVATQLDSAPESPETQPSEE